MRSIWLGLAVFAVLATGLHNAQSQAGNRKVSKRPAAPVADLAPERPPEREEDIVEGYGVNGAKASEQALLKAQERVREQLAEKLGTSWRPSQEVLDPDNLTRFDVIRVLGESREQTIDGERRMVTRYHVQLTTPYLHEVARVARHQQMGDRHLIAGRILVGLVSLLLVVAGYLRLEDLTHGYATTMLRAAAVVILLIVGLGLTWPYFGSWGG